MSTMVINATQPSELRVALFDKKLYDLDIERADEAPTKANIYGNAVIRRIEKSLEAAFVDYGSERHGFLPLKDIAPSYFTREASGGSQASEPVADLLKVGQRLIVQVEKEERGNKGAALTTYISLAGSYLVLMPNNPRVGGISRRIDGQERDQLKKVVNQIVAPKGMGFIVRTAGLGKTVEELQWDLDVLVNHWRAIEKAANEPPETKSQRPFLLHQDGDVVVRAIRDNLRPEVSEVIVDDPKAFEMVQRYIQQIKPDFDQDKIKLHDHAEPLFSYMGIEREIEKAQQREVHLPSGGMLVIDRAEALVAIDINSSKATKGSDIEQTAFQTNLEAAEEIARQLRLRDLGGLVVIDFIDMDNDEHKKAVESRLQKSVAFDRARIQMDKISRFGLLEMSRQRLKSPLGSSARSSICPRCAGQGVVPHIEDLAKTLVRLLQQEVLAVNHEQIQLYVPLEMATYLLNECREEIVHIEATYKKPISIVPNPNLQSPQYHLKIIASKDVEKGVTLPSTYTLISPKNFKTPKRSKEQAATPAKKAAVEHFIGQEGTAARPSPKGTGIIDRLKSIFVAEEPTPEPQVSESRGAKSQRSRPSGENGSKASGNGRGHQGGGQSNRSSGRKNAPQNKESSSGAGRRRPNAQAAEQAKKQRNATKNTPKQSKRDADGQTGRSCNVATAESEVNGNVAAEAVAKKAAGGNQRRRRGGRRGANKPAQDGAHGVVNASSDSKAVDHATAQAPAKVDEAPKPVPATQTSPQPKPIVANSSPQRAASKAAETVMPLPQTPTAQDAGEHRED